MKRSSSRAAIVMMAICAIGLTGATAASATVFSSETYPSAVELQAISGSEFVSGIKSVACQAQPGGEDTLSAASESVAPEVGDSASCNSSGSLKMNGCRFVFNAGGTGEIGPPGCGTMVLKHGTCEWSFSPQSFGDVAYENNGEGAASTVVVQVQGATLKYTNGSGCPGSGEANATYTANWELSAANEASEPTGISVRPSAVYLSGEESGEPSKQPKLNAETYPTPIVGVQSGEDPHVLKLGIREITCGSIDLDGELSAATTQVSLAAAYGSCVATNVLPTTVSMNSCHYDLNVLNAGPPYAGSIGVACSKEGDTIEAKVWSGKASFEEGKPPACVYTIAPQSGLGSVGLTTVGLGVAVDLNLSGISYSITGAPLVCGTTKYGGTYVGGSTLYGV